MQHPAKRCTTVAEVLSRQPLVGDSPPMQALKAYIAQVAGTNSNILITGETGTGKELVAEQIHQHSRRAQQPFVCLNCPAVPDSLFESELFGYERGAFTGATALNRGKLELAHGGTLFLDEIGDMSVYAQAKILRAVDGKAVHRVGGQRSIPLNVRIIAATNQDLERLVGAGQFRKDLYYRLNVARIHLPPLRDRKQDLAPLCAHYIQTLNQQWSREVKGFTTDAFDSLVRYDWPGNVRELKHLLEAVFINLDAQMISLLDLPEPFRRHLQKAAGRSPTERDVLLSTLLATNWNKTQAAQKLRWSRMTLYRKLEKYQITVPRERQPRHLSTYSCGQSTGEVAHSTPPRRQIVLRSHIHPELPAWELPDTVWQRMAALIPPPKSQAGRPRTVDLRRVTEGIFYVLQTGIPWQACPRERFGPPSTVYAYFSKWVRAGVFAPLWAEAQALAEHRNASNPSGVRSMLPRSCKRHTFLDRL